MKQLLSCHTKGLIEAGCDEAGRGCLAGPVFAAAVILPKSYTHSLLRDSKQLSEKQRYLIRIDIEKDAIAFAVASLTNKEIDKYNILNASIRAMHKALSNLNFLPEQIIVDGNKFIPYQDIPHHSIVKGDNKFLSIAAASVLAKTYRDDFMCKLHQELPQYGWDKNKGYPTKKHREGIRKYGVSKHHRMTFRLLPEK